MKKSLNRDLNPGAPEYKASHYTATFVTCYTASCKKMYAKMVLPRNKRDVV